VAKGLPAYLERVPDDYSRYANLYYEAHSLAIQGVFFTKKQIIALVEKHRRLEQLYFNQEVKAKPKENQSETLQDEYSLFRGIYEAAQYAESDVKKPPEPSEQSIISDEIHPQEEPHAESQFQSQVDSM
jgi:hypothetical protein